MPWKILKEEPEKLNQIPALTVPPQLGGHWKILEEEEPEKERIIPPMYSPQYWAGAAQRVPGQAVELVKGLAGLPKSLIEMGKEVRKPEEVVTKLAWPLAKGLVKGTAESLYKSVRYPHRTIYEEPLEFGLNAMILVSAGMGAASRIGKMVSGVRRARDLMTDIKTVDKAGNITKQIVAKVPDQILPDEILAESAKATSISQLVPGGNVKQVLGALGIPGIERKLRYLTDAFHSPKQVFGRSPAGARMYDSLDTADYARLKWVNDIPKAFHKKIGIKEGDPLGSGVFKVKEASPGYDLSIKDVIKMTPEEASKFDILPEELSAIKRNPRLAQQVKDTLIEYFELALRRWGLSKVGAEREKVLWGLSNKVRKRKVSQKWLDELPELEKEVFIQYQAKIKDYVTHLFTDRDDLVSMIESQLAKDTMKLGRAEPGSIKYNKLSEDVADAEAKLKQLRVGKPSDPILMDMIPQKLRFKFFEPRRGEPGFLTDPVKAFDAYIPGIARKIFDEPAVQKALLEWDNLPLGQRAYVRTFLRKYLGMDRTPLDSTWGNIKAIQWIRTLGANPRSAIVNFTQKINTIAEAGPAWSTKGWLYGFTDEGKALFEASGIPRTIPSVLMEGGTPSNALEGLRKVTGFMFQRVEKGNQKHAFLTGYLRGASKGLSKEQAIKEGIALFEKTQFRYGRMGMPMALRGPGGVALQFWSYPIKQLEFLSSLAKENPLKLLSWIAMAEGGNLTLEKLLGMDLSNALGMGFNYGELFEALRAIPSGDLKKIRYHLSLSDVPLIGGEKGGGIFPYGLGPTANSLLRIFKVLGSVNSEFDDLTSEIEPVMMTRARQAIKAFKEGGEGEYPVYHPYREELLYLEKLPQLISRTAFVKPAEETRQQRTIREARISEEMRRKTMQQVTELFAKGETAKALNMAQKYGISISPRSIRALIEKGTLTRLERLRTPRTAGRWQEYLER